MINFDERRKLLKSMETKEKDNIPIDEVTRLRRWVKEAYVEGWIEGHNSDATQEALEYDWDLSAARAAIREGGG